MQNTYGIIRLKSVLFIFTDLSVKYFLLIRETQVTTDKDTNTKHILIKF
jgi:hypothetical protein